MPCSAESGCAGLAHVLTQGQGRERLCVALSAAHGQAWRRGVQHETGAVRGRGVRARHASQ
jgi:hypothetical protein